MKIKINIKKNKELGVYKVNNYKIGDYVKFDGGEEIGEDVLRIEGFSDDGKKVFGCFESDDCGGEIELDWIKEVV